MTLPRRQSSLAHPVCVDNILESCSVIHVILP